MTAALDDLTRPGFKVPPHPLLPWPFSPDQMRAAIRTDPAGLGAEILQLYHQRQRRLHLAGDNGDPLYHGFDLAHWADADRLLAEDILFLILLGGNRSAKSEYCAKRLVRDAWATPDANLLCISETEDASRDTQQRLIWKYLPAALKALNFKNDPRHIFKIRWSAAGGFTEGLLVLPNRTKIHCKTYNQDPNKECEGQEFGHPDKMIAGVWADESMRLNWLAVLVRRLRFRPAHLLWSFTPVRGMTPAIKEAVGSGRILETRPSPLLPDRVNVPGCPPGHMPYLQESALGRGRVLYFFTEFNPFGAGGRSYYEAVKEDCAGKPTQYTMRIAYGYTNDLSGKCFPLFGPWNIVPRAALPAKGTRYFFLDPHGTRNWAMLWVLVTDDDPPEFYVYRDWPDKARHGEWAVPTEREVNDSSRRGWDGDPGPAQENMGLSINGYKQLILAEETATEPAGAPAREVIFERFMDPRFGRSAQLAERQGGTCLQEQMEQADTDPKTGAELAPALDFSLWSGVQEDEGLELLKRLLEWEKERPLIPHYNAPRLYVTDNCAQVIWALENYTGRAGKEGACKDWIDLLRGLALADLEHIDADRLMTWGGGSY